MHYAHDERACACVCGGGGGGVYYYFWLFVLKNVFYNLIQSFKQIHTYLQVVHKYRKQ